MGIINVSEKYTLMICVSRIMFLSTSKVLPDPKRPLWPGLSTRMSEAIFTLFPLISSILFFCSLSQTLYTSGTT